MNEPEPTTEGLLSQPGEALKVQTSDRFTVVRRDEYQVSLRTPIPDVVSTRNSRDRFLVLGFIITSYRESVHRRQVSVQARKQRKVGDPHDAVTTIRTDDPRVASALRAALHEIGITHGTQATIRE